MSYDESRAMVTHYARLGYARHVQTTCANAARALGNDPALSFWRAFGTIAEGGHSEAITKLEAMLTHADRDIELACMAAIVHAHKSARVVDEDSVERYETRVLSEEQSASATALVECATFYHLAGGPDAGRAKDTARRALDLAPGDVRAKTLLGWIEMTGRGDGDAGDEPGTGTGTASGVLTSARSATSRRRAAAAVRVFDEVLRSPDKGGEAAIDALLGKARAMTVLSRYDAAVDVMNELAARHPGFAPAASERAKARLAACDFEGAAENARRGLAEDPEDIECHRVMVFLSLSRDGDVQAARRQMASLEEALERREPRNAFLFLETSRDAARVAGGDAAVLASCGRLLEKARSLRPDDGAVSCESAYQARLAGKYGDAIELYAAAATAAEAEGRLDDLTPMYGTILCQILDRRVSEAASQLEFLEDIATDENDLVFAFLNALNAHAVNAEDADARAEELQRRAALFLESVLKKPPALDFFAECDPDVLLRCASLFSERDGSVDGTAGARDAGTADAGTAESETETPRALRILEALCRRAPGMRGAQEHLMRARFAAGFLDAAARTAHALLRLDDAHGEAHVTVARVHLAKGAHTEARQALDAAAANDFSVRETTAYAVVSANCRAAEGDAAGALRELELAMALPGIRHVLSAKEAQELNKSRSNNHGAPVPISVADRASTYIAYARALAASGRVDDAERAVDQAADAFAGTSAEVSVMLARCEMAMARGDDTRALRALSKVTPSSPHYPAATLALADVYLSKRGDVAAYVRCHRELAENRPKDVSSHLRLAEAYTQVGQPSAAASAYEKAASLAPNDAQIARRLGAALAATHDFKRAAACYENALTRREEIISARPAVRRGRRESDSRTDSDEKSIGVSDASTGRLDETALDISLELAELYKRMRRWDDAEKALSRVFLAREEGKNKRVGDSDLGVSSLSSSRRDVRAFKLLCGLKAARGDQNGHLDALLNLKDAQEALVKTAASLGGTDEDRRSLEEYKKAVVETCAEAAGRFASFHDFANALKFFDEALRFDPGNVAVMAQVARLKLNALGDADGAEKDLRAILRQDAEHEDANFMLAELMFVREDVDGALFHVRESLRANPHQFASLARLCRLLHRAGRVAELEPFMENARRLFFHGGKTPRADQNSKRSAKEDDARIVDPGYWFVRGLRESLVGDADGALASLNRCRGDARFGIDASYLMAEIYVAPESFPPVAPAGKKPLDPNARRERGAFAEQLLHEIGPSRRDPKHCVLEAYCLMARGDKKSIDTAFDVVSEVLNRDQDNAWALLALASCFELQKLPAKTKTQLKRLATMPRRADEADAFEAAWLASAEFFFDSARYDQAQELCQRCLHYNKSCARAWELMGMICERESTATDAAECYENAWRSVGNSDPSVGFKLAFVLFKARQMVACVDVCRAVLDKHPGYPKIEKDIMRKAQASIRP